MALRHNLLGAAIGFLFTGGSLWGALLGWFLAGTYSERRARASDKESIRRNRPYSRRTTGRSNTTHGTGGAASGQRFFSALMALAAIVMKADGRVTRDELDVVKSFLARNFPEDAEFCLGMLREFTKCAIPPAQAKSIASRMSVSLTAGERLVLLQFLVEIASADGTISYDEILRLRQIASGLNISQSTLDSIIAMFARGGARGGYRRGGHGSGGGARTSADDEGNDYAILEVSPSATNEEIKKSYRKLAMKHHPDRVATASPAVQKAAAEKFKKISAAYDRISKRRGM